MIYLTGDVHSSIPGHFQTKKVKSELEATQKFLEICKKNKVSCTLFLNGELLDNEFDKVKLLLGKNVEIGGHTYDNYGGKISLVKSFLYRKKYGCIYGPRKYQEKDIAKTRKAFEKRNIKMNSWRSHAYGSNKETFEILKKNNVKFVSDLFEQKPFEEKGLIHLPLNVPVDNSTIAYGPLKPSNRDPFAGCTKGRISPEEWFSILKTRVQENEKKGIPSIILIHPITMAYLDNFNLFQKIAKFLSRYKTAKFEDFKL